MRGNGLGAALVGGGAADRSGALRKGAAMLKKAAGGAAGFPIPEGLKERIGRFDTNKDDHLSTAEIDAMPEPARTRVRQALANLGMGGAGKP